MCRETVLAGEVAALTFTPATFIIVMSNTEEPKSPAEVENGKKEEVPKEEKKHDVEYATDETKGVVSTSNEPPKPYYDKMRPLKPPKPYSNRINSLNKH